MPRPLRFIPEHAIVEYRARAAGKDVRPGEFATSYDVKLTPLPCVLEMTTDQRQAHYRRVAREIDAAAYAANKEKGRTPLGVERILAQDPHHRPSASAGLHQDTDCVISESAT
jgi:hypothetical protein